MIVDDHAVIRRMLREVAGYLNTLKNEITVNESVAEDSMGAMRRQCKSC
jgi:hypothetical protein